MTRLSSIFIAIALGGCFATVDEQGRVVGGEASFTVALPTILPPLVVVEPGVSVVSDLDDEVFYADGYYWTRRNQYWIRSRDHRSGWSRVDRQYVPAPLVQSQPGRYRHYRGDGHRQDDRGRGRDEERGRGRGHDRD